MSASFDNLFSIKGKTALVTGGSRGIGEMIAAGFMAHGAKVYISSRKADACEATARRLTDASRDSTAWKTWLRESQSANRSSISW
jgi:NAD(P)-dependent dehydrogenase (short-subunit alcohol dehydrogenase family)